MLNTKYFIFEDGNQRLTAQQNPGNNGNAWFVNSIKIAKNANEEITSLDSLKTKNEAVIDAKLISDNFVTEYANDSTATIELIKYKDNELTYEVNSSSNRFTVFSEIYYKDGWNAYIDGNLTPHLRVNYVLRGMEIPAGMILSNCIGVGDEGYTGEYQAVFYDIIKALPNYEVGDRILQMEVEERFDLEFVQMNELPKSSRGKDGYGSTGLKNKL